MATTEPLYVLPVKQVAAHRLACGGTRQVSRNYPPLNAGYIDRWVAIQSTYEDLPSKAGPVFLAPTWSIVAVGKLTGAGHHPGFSKAPTTHLGRSYRREKGQAGAWIWTFSNVTRLEPIALARLEPIKHAHGHSDDDGSGGWWSSCLRQLDEAMVECVREARRKARAR